MLELQYMWQFAKKIQFLPLCQCWREPNDVAHSVAKYNTVRYRYNVVNFLKNICERHPIAHPLGWGMGCILWIQHLIDILLELLQLLMQYLTILGHVITALDCMSHNHDDINGCPNISSIVHHVIHNQILASNITQNIPILIHFGLDW